MEDWIGSDDGVACQMQWPQSVERDGSLAQRFLGSWKDPASPPDVFAYLASNPNCPTSEILDVVRVDQNCRWQHGRAIPAERYFGKLPALGEDLTSRYELVYAELQLLRERWLSNALDLRCPEVSEKLGASPSPIITPSEEGIETAAVERAESTDTRLHFRSYFRNFLPACGPFGKLPAVVIDLIASYMKRVTFPAGSVLIQQGDRGEHLLVLVEGEVDIVIRDETGQASVIDHDCAPSIIGEMALLTKEPRTASVVATTTVEAGILPARDFRYLRAEHPILGEVLTSLLADRIGNKSRDALGGNPLGGYRVHERVGIGGMGIVYRASHVETGQVVALKMLSHRQIHDPLAVEMFQREARTLRELDHPNIAKLHHWFPAFETFFLVLDYCDGVTLGKLIRHHGGLPPDQVRRILGSVAGALAAAHSRSIVHRDLKPGNIMISRDGTVLLMDFGLATKTEGDDIAGSDVIMGTPTYMAPEQHYTSDLTNKCDLYSLGCVVYEMLVGKPLFPKMPRLALFTAKVEFQLPDQSQLEVPSDLYEILTNTLHYYPQDRDLDFARIGQWAGKVDPQLVEQALET